MKKKRRGFNRAKILERASHRCEECETTENLEIHHKDGDRSNSNQENAQVLCKECHKRRAPWILEEAKFLEEQLIIRRKDIALEEAILFSWLESGRTQNEIGGTEYKDFESHFLKSLRKKS